MESTNGAGLKTVTWEDPRNPYERERNGQWPVGLKNVGQTCWFSAVIQSLFYVPAFRNLVLSFQPQPSASAMPPPDSTASSSSCGQSVKSGKINEFMGELRKLFALMLASERKYVDPSATVELLRAGFKKSDEMAVVAGPAGLVSGGRQEDVSECMHILFEWMEEAFKMYSKPSAEAAVSATEVTMGEGEEVLPPSQTKREDNAMDDEAAAGAQAEGAPKAENNPMTQLFYGRIEVQGSMKGGETFRRQETCSQHALQVSSFADIHESLEDATAKKSFENASTQERWFTELPPVLFFSLSRFNYNVGKRAAEKVHNRLDFPEVLYMDRYMLANQEETTAKRKEVANLKQRREELKAKLQQFTSYGSDEQARLPLNLVLQYAAEFASAGAEKDVNMPSPRSEAAAAAGLVPSGSQMQVDSPCHSPGVTPASSIVHLPEGSAKDQDLDAMDVEMEDAKQAGAEGQAMTDTTTTTTQTTVTDAPRPRHVSEAELRVIQVRSTL